jgi:chaperonin GroES
MTHHVCNSALALTPIECQCSLSTKNISHICGMTAEARLLPMTFNQRSPRMKFRPLHDRVVVRRVEEDTKTKGGIIIPDTAQEKPMQGEIIAVGPGGRDEAGKLIPIDVRVGEIVLFGKWSGTEVKIDGEELLIMKESDIMGVVEGKATIKAPVKKAA